jgi:hypothetical protein
LNPIIFSMDAANTGKGFAVECLVVAGGAGGGMDMGGGGGGGQAIQTVVQVVNGISYPVTVGAGGAGSPGSYAGPPASGNSGGASTFGGVFMFGGGGGGSGHYFPYPYPSLNRQGQPGGGEDGGNAGGDSPVWGRNRGSGQTSSYGGYSGGSAGYNGDGSYTAGGGGGAAGHGNGGRGSWQAGSGGIGLLSAINGTSLYWGGGGGGSAWTNTAGAGGAGGGGGGTAGTGGTAGSGGAGLNAGANGAASTNSNGGNGGANTGGGGGGGTHAYSVGGNGGSGIVIIRYYGSQKATGGTITSSGGYTVHTFTSSGTFTPTDNISAADMGQLNTTLTPINVTRGTTNGGSFDFDGTSSYIDLNSTNLITGTNPFSFDCFYTLSGSTAAELLGNYGAGYTSNSVWISGRYGLYISGSVYFPGAPIANGTYHMACTRNSSGACVVYLNGVQVSTGTLTGSIPANINFRIGSDVNGIAETLTGSIYSMKVYSRVLTPEEIFQNFCAQRGRFGI